MIRNSAEVPTVHDRTGNYASGAITWTCGLVKNLASAIPSSHLRTLIFILGRKSNLDHKFSQCLTAGSSRYMVPGKGTMAC